MLPQRLPPGRLLALLLAVTVTLCNPASAAMAADPAASLAPPYRPPYQPASDADLLQEVPSLEDPAVAGMRARRRTLDAAPHDVRAALALANTYIDYSRQIGDAHYAGYAEAVIAPWMALPSPPAGVLLTQATILQYRHEFAPARELLDRALRQDPRNGQAWLTSATLYMVQGNFAAASRACAQVTNTAGLELGLACLGNLRSYTGQAKQSLALLQQADNSSTGASAVYRGWIQGLMAETAERLGDWQAAELHYRAALEAQPRDNFLLVAYADFLLDRGRPREVLPLLAAQSQSDTAFLRLALAADALHAPDAGRYTWTMAARFEALKLRGSDYFGREESRFALRLGRDPQAALQLATRNWQVQRAPWDARVLLEAALAAHQPAAAAEVIAFIKETRLEDPMVLALAQQLSAAP
jgi:Tfp pilus assembly protein PilF